MYMCYSVYTIVFLLFNKKTKRQESDVRVCARKERKRMKTFLLLHSRSSVPSGASKV